MNLIELFLSTFLPGIHGDLYTVLSFGVFVGAILIGLEWLMTAMNQAAEFRRESDIYKLGADAGKRNSDIDADIKRSRYRAALRDIK